MTETAREIYTIRVTKTSGLRVTAIDGPGGRWLKFNNQVGDVGYGVKLRYEDALELGRVLIALGEADLEGGTLT